MARPKGTPNRATADVRAAIATVAEACAPKIQGWLDDIEDAGKRFDLYLKMLEYHVPKLGRVELTGKDGGPLQVRVVSFGDAKSSFTGTAPRTTIRDETNSVPGRVE